MPQPINRRLNSQKLLSSKWTAAVPRDKEKHFIVTQMITPTQPGLPIKWVELEAVYSRRSFSLPWRELTDTGVWLPGWQ
jgi:tryptophan-rich hypothetical protein